MPPFLSASKALRSVVSRKNVVRQLISSGKSNERLIEPDRCRYSSTVAAIRNRSIHKPFACRADPISLRGGLCSSNSVQMRQFLGCGDGEEGVLSRSYEEKRVLG